MKCRPGLEDLKQYSIDESDWEIKLDANEKPEGLPPVVATALAERFSSLEFNRYPQITSLSLRTKLANLLGVTSSMVQVGNGSSELLAAICYAFGGPECSIVYPDPSFSMYSVYAKLSDSRAIAVKLKEDFSLPVDEYMKAAKQANLAILCNPNNPTGNVTPLHTIELLAKELSCPLVVDEAYFEFCKVSAIDLIKQYPNIIVVRTFSKAYGLAAARVGYLIASPYVSSLIGKALLPYHVSALALAAAETAVDYWQEFMPGIERIICERERLAAQIAKIPGISVFPSKTNFLLIQTSAFAKLTEMLASAKIGVRDFSRTSGLTGCFRITVGSERENDAVLAILEQVVHYDQ